MARRNERAISDSRRTAHSKRSVHRYVSIASTAQHKITARAAITGQNNTIETPSGCEVKRLSVHGGCLGNQ
ncbi:hypothetical protein, partial [Providencia rettgeri]|uniref:hypothetical protein n=1 Tax=Providencia rettgeri TaxID=587 RepID=UPI00236023DD